MSVKSSLQGQSFGSLRVYWYIGSTNSHARWLCKCECGTWTKVYAKNLRSGHTKTCGNKTVHGRASVGTTYDVAHVNVAKRWGKANTYVCGCGKPAETWAYLHSDPDEMTTPGGYRYTLSTEFKHWAPMCRSCHHAFDAERRAVR